MGINRGTVLDLINDVHRAGGFKDYNSYSYLFNQVDTMPESKEDAEPHWIPVTERLPEKFDYYLVSGINSVWFARYESGRFLGILSGHALDTVIAWMPLPEPFKGVTE